MGEPRETGIVDLWTLPLDVSSKWLAGPGAPLDADDWTRVRRVVRADKRRERFASLAWRTIVEARYARSREEPAGPGPNLSLSHSSNWMLIATCWGDRIGVDIERTRPVLRLDRLIRRFFSDREADELLRLEREEREAAFFRTWVRKEAYLKAVGGGVPADLRRFSVSVASDEPPAIRSTGLEDGGVSSFSLHDLDVPEGHAGAVAVEGTGHRICYMSL